MVITPSKPLERKNKILFWQTRSIIRLFCVIINDYSFYNSYLFSYLYIYMHYKELRFKVYQRIVKVKKKINNCTSSFRFFLI